MHKEIRDELLNKVKAGLDGPAKDLEQLVHNYKDFIEACDIDNLLGDCNFWDIVEPATTTNIKPYSIVPVESFSKEAVDNAIYAAEKIAEESDV